MKDENKLSEIYEWMYYAYENDKCIHIFTEQQIEETQFCKEDIDECLKSNKLYKGYSWQRNRKKKEKDLIIGTPLEKIEEQSKISNLYIQHLNIPKSDSSIPLSYEDIYKQRFISELFEFLKQNSKTKMKLSQENNIILCNVEGSLIGTFHIGNKFFNSQKVSECEVIFFYNNEKLLKQHGIKNKFLKFQNKNNFHDYEGKKIKISFLKNFK